MAHSGQAKTRRLALLSLALGAGAWLGAATAASAESTGTFLRSLTTKMFSTGYENIAELYLHEVDVGRLALTGLSGLSALDPNVQISVANGAVQVFQGQHLVWADVAPNTNSIHRWAELTTNVLALSRTISPTLGSSEPEALYQAVFEHMLEGLDRFSRYAGPETANDHRAARDGFGGVGIRIEAESTGVRVLEVLPDSPARDQGLLANDFITHVNGRSVVGQSQGHVVDQLRGRVNTYVQLVVHRAGEARPREVSLKRQLIVLPTVQLEYVETVAHLTISGFNQRTAQHVREAVREAERALGDRLTGLIVDLRGNPGGLLNQAVAVSDAFISSGKILTALGRHPDSYQSFEAAGDDIAHGKRIVVLVDGSSASAAEIVAAALQDSGRAVVVGTGSYGKGSVQTVIPLPNNGELTITWALLHAPSGYTFHKLGVIPTICSARNATSSQDLIAISNREAGRVAALQAKRHMAITDEQTLSRMREFCAWRTNEGTLAFDVALDLLRQPQQFTRALRTGRPSIATTRPATGGQ